MNRNSLAVQWLGLQAFIAKDTGSIPDWGTKIQQVPQSGQKEKKVEKEKVADMEPGSR